MVSIDSFESKYLPIFNLITTVVINSFKLKYITTNNPITTAEIDSFKSIYISINNLIIMVSTNSLDSKYLTGNNLVNTLLYYPLQKFWMSIILDDFLDITSMSEKILTIKIYLTKEQVLTYLIKFWLIVQEVEINHQSIVTIKYQSIVINLIKYWLMVEIIIKHRSIVVMTNPKVSINSRDSGDQALINIKHQT